MGLTANEFKFSERRKGNLTGWWWYESIETADKDGITPYGHFRFWRDSKYAIIKEEKNKLVASFRSLLLRL
jgi:hypothetical protein